ncbi:uncharacterized protein FOMMEDRAFT_32035 [Fomitiporia mediterranea MF3/22]|uniref:uncharacterized protein n=1 Tax=Fomitiporia mediterranea (strain MF3/22) TaxID=694068 RepID=UPI000440876E|nr:uncharacterized protein FOMMEDRAFT_32035 [Fomitiporia mediterranea MF3/22]EJC98298.1 hypothetical protein FOMMEDRAFT_32035 [Fomitiporia mediterranea MF3/22]
MSASTSQPGRSKSKAKKVMTEDEVTASRYNWDFSQALSDFSMHGVTIKGIRLKTSSGKAARYKALEFIPVKDDTNKMVVTKLWDIHDHLLEEYKKNKISTEHILLLDTNFRYDINLSGNVAVTILEILEGDNEVLVFEYAKGGNLDDWRKEREPSMPIEMEVACIGYPKRILFMEEANKYQGLDIGKDLKISNMRKGEGTEQYDKLEAKISINHDGIYEYLDYLPPEVTDLASNVGAGASRLTPAVDVFSAGMILAEMLNVRPPSHRMTANGEVMALTEYDVSYLAGCCTTCEENWKKISKKGRDIIKNLTRANYKERPSAKKAVALVVEWINQLGEDERQRQYNEREKKRKEQLKEQHERQHSKSSTSQTGKEQKVYHYKFKKQQ